jgi:polysaccharide biosynthesis protein PslF
MESASRHSLPATKVAIVGTYPPTQCGIATFTAALRTAVASTGLCDCAVVEMTTDRHPSRPEVARQIVVGDSRSLADGAALLDSFDAVFLQHEFGIFGGPDGADVLRLVQGFRAPLIVTLHTVPLQPTCAQQVIIEELAARAAVCITMTVAARDRLLAGYRVDPAAVVVIPHGAHPVLVPEWHQSGKRPTILTWGLIGPGKGLDTAIAAVAQLGDITPRPQYVIAGETHPKVKARMGETYRRSLMELTRVLGIDDMVVFDPSYRDVESLTELVVSADVVLLPYESREQVTSGVLVDAVSAGRPVVATAFPHAVELLGQGAGLVVGHDDVDGMAQALRAVLTRPRLAERMHRRALGLADSMAWPNVGARYAQLACELVAARSAKVA